MIKIPKTIDIGKHILVPKHSKLSEKEKKDLLEKYRISVTDLPKIMVADAAIETLDIKENDVIKIVRQSPTAKMTVFYRRVAK